MFSAFIYSMEFLNKMWNSLLQLFFTVLPDYVDVYLKQTWTVKIVVCIQLKDFWVMFFIRKKNSDSVLNVMLLARIR